MANEHPFQHLFETLGRVPISHAESVNREAYEILSKLLAVPVENAGRCVLLRAPRGGHGKTHLLSRIQHELGGGYEFIPLHSLHGCQIDAATVLGDVLRRLVRQVPAGEGLTVLDQLTRRLFATALQPLVSSGDVPCQDRDGALTALRLRPIETFDFHHPNAVTAHWALENSEVLGQRLALELSYRSGLAVSEIAYWVEVLFRFAASPLDHSNRVKALMTEVQGVSSLAKERLETLLGLLTHLIRVVLVADDLESFSTDETAALRFAAFLGSLRHSVERVDVILSLNQDIWASAFEPRLSSGLADRLTEVVVELAPLTEQEMGALLDSRVPGLGTRLLAQIDVGSAGTHARGLIRAAGMAWIKATTLDSTPKLAVTPSPETLSLVKARLPHEPPPLPAWIPEPELEPEAELVPELQPEISSEPKLVAASESESELEPEPELVIASEPEPTPKPEPEVISEPVAVAEPELISEPVAVAEPEREPEPELVIVSEPELTPKTKPELISEPVVVAEPEPELEPELVIVSEPELTPKTELELISEPVVVVEPEPKLEPEPEPEPELVIAFEPEPTLKPELEPISEPVLVVEPKPEPAFVPPPLPAWALKPELIEEPLVPIITTTIEIPQVAEIQPTLPPPELKPATAEITPFWPVPVLSSPVKPASPTLPPPVISPFTVVIDPVDAGFTPIAGQEKIPEITVDSLPPVEPPAPPAEPIALSEPETVSPPETDRVDSLLRQFRERYGRGNS
jgi:hypothetical protein